MVFQRLACVAPMLAVAVLTGACGRQREDVRDTAPRAHLPVRFVNAPPDLMSQCRRTARLVGYAAPCPTRIPRGFSPTAAATKGCRFAVVGLPPCGPAGSWKGWISGSGNVAWPPEHLIIEASPQPIRDYAKVVNGPAWYPGARVDVGARTTVHGWRVRWIFVPPETNDGSAFAGHVVLVWTTGGHTYAVGFHDTSTRAQTRAMDLELVRHIRMV